MNRTFLNASITPVRYGKFTNSLKSPVSIGTHAAPGLNRLLLVLGCLAVLPCLGFSAEELQEVPPDEIDWAKEKRFWSFQPPKAHERPAVKNKSWARQPLDYFILARLEEKRLTPSSEADKRILVRRLTFDLTGLPPTPEEVETFLKDKSRDAYERLVERLLASPRFGERLTSLWLPLARYAEDQAHQVGSDTKSFYPNAYKYREWVCDAFNRDLPYNEFIRLQLAADKLAENPKNEAETSREPSSAVAVENSKPSANDDLAALGFLGLGHKYYNRNRVEVMADEWEDRVDTVTRTFLGLTVSCARCHNHKFDPITMRDYYALAGVFASTKLVNKSPDGKLEEAGVTADKMRKETVHVVEDDKVQDLNLFVRGNVDRKGPVVERRFLQILSDGQPVAFKEGSGRKELAATIADRKNPLTARVLVNRIWGMMYGKPLVVTPSNFGHYGEKPSHPELLDDLAVRFMEGGWSVKALVREMALSATYRQGSLTDAKKTAVDSANDSLWRMNRRRLSVEQWRDAVLELGGELQPPGGQSLELDDPANLRRTVYARVSRLKLNDMFMQFDYPDANVHAETRSASTTATQKLFLLNSPFVLARSKALAARLTANPRESEETRVAQAYRLLYSREPERAETKLTLEFLRQRAPEGVTRWEQYAQMLLASNEMFYVD